MPDYRYNMLKKGLDLLKISERTNLDPAGLKSFLEEYKKKRQYNIPEDFLCTVCDYRIEIVASRPCIIAKPFDIRPERAVLLFYGGGYYKTPDRNDFEYMVQVVRETKSEVWFPLYPLAPEADIAAITEHAVGVYGQMLKSWAPGEIVLQGNSSGGTTCLYLCMKIKRDGEALPYPSRILLLSPAVQMPPSEEQTSKMKELEEKDAVLSVQYCHSIAAILRHPDYDYLSLPFEFDWTGFPPMMVVYGTDEIFSVFLPELRETGRKYHVLMRGHNGKGMFHCWPLYGNFDAAKKARRKMFSFICGIEEGDADFDSDERELDFACVYTARDDVEARMIENLLYENSIACFRRNLNNAGFMTVYGGNSRMGVEIYVRQEDEEEAREVLNFEEPLCGEDN